MNEMVVSEKRSFEGYKFTKWFLGNWKTIKEILKFGIPLGVGWATTNNPALIGIITICGKFIIDLGEYYWKEHTE